MRVLLLVHVVAALLGPAPAHTARLGGGGGGMRLGLHRFCALRGGGTEERDELRGERRSRWTLPCVQRGRYPSVRQGFLTLAPRACAPTTQCCRRPRPGLASPRGRSWAPLQLERACRAPRARGRPRLATENGTSKWVAPVGTARARARVGPGRAPEARGTRRRRLLQMAELSRRFCQTKMKVRRAEGNTPGPSARELSPPH